MIKLYLKQQLNKNLIENLKRGFINNIKNNGLNYAFYSINNGNIKYTLVYSNKDKILNLYALIGFYSTLLNSFKIKKLNKELKEVLIK